MDDKDDYALSFLPNINILITPSTSTSAPSTPSSTSEVTVEPGERFYRARLIVENHLYDELLNRYHLATTRLKEVTREANMLQEENEWLRLANEDLALRIQSLVLRCSDSSSGATAAIKSVITSWSCCNKSDNVADISSSPTSVMDNVERVSLPRSISVRSPGYFKLPTTTPPSPATSNPSRVPSQNANPITKLRVRKEETAVELEVYGQGMHKTELCNKWEQTGTCPYGNHCRFAHGISELRPVIRHPRYKTQVCRMILAGTTCPYGHRCHFSHSLPLQPSHTSHDDHY